MRRARIAVALVTAVAVIVVATAVRATNGNGRQRHGVAAAAVLASEAVVLPDPQRPAFAVGRVVRLSERHTPTRSAPVVQAVAARAQPSPAARRIADLALETPEGTTNVVLVLGQTTRGGRQWVHVRLPVLPNSLTGWVPRDALGGYHFVHTGLIVDRARLTATLLDDGRPIFRARIGTGRPEFPTPAGEFYIREKLSGFGDPFYGPVAFGTSARSALLTDWPGGGFIGIHGTNQPDLIPGRISHGCIRMRNPDILRLSRLMPVGTPVSVR